MTNSSFNMSIRVETVPFCVYVALYRFVTCVIFCESIYRVFPANGTQEGGCCKEGVVSKDRDI